MNILKGIYKRPVTILLIIILSITIGIFSTSSMPINLLPDISFPMIGITTTYVGADAETVEKDLTTPLEEGLSTIKGIRNLSSYSIDNASVLLLEFEYGTKLNPKISEVNERIKELSLPSNASSPSITTVDLNGNAITSIALYSSSESNDDLYEIATQYQTQILGIQGVGSVKMVGAKDYKVLLEPYHGLESMTLLIIEALSNSGYDIPLGEITINGETGSITNTSSSMKLEELMNLTVSLDLEEKTKSSFLTFQKIISKYESMSLEELEAMKKDCDTMRNYISIVENKTPSYLSTMNEHLLEIKIMDTLLSDLDLNHLHLLYDTVISPLLENETFQSLTPAEIQTLALDFKIDAQVLFLLQDYGKKDPVTEKTRISSLFDLLFTFKESHYSSYTDDEFVELLYRTDSFSEDPASENYIEQEAILQKIKDARAINPTELSKIIEKKEQHIDLTDEDFSKLFLLSYSTIIPTEAMGILRSASFEENYQKVYDFKAEHSQDMSDEDLYSLYISLENVQNIFPIQLNKDLIHFIRNVDFSLTNTYCKVSDFAKYEMVDSYDSIASYNGVSCINLEVYANSNSNSTEIVQKIEKMIQKDSSTEYSAVMLNNSAAFISDSLSNMLVSLIIGGLLSILTIYVFLRKVPSSLIIALSMPLSILLSLSVLYFMGITLNMVSVGGLAVGIGMLVDNSIVVLESISNEREKGLDALEAAKSGTKLVMGSLFGSTITSICVFFPILFINGLTKEIFADLAYSVILSLSFSLLVAIIIIPTLYSLLYRRKKIEKAAPTSIMERLKEKYAHLLKQALTYKRRTILIAMCIFLASILLVFTLSIEFLPSIDQRKIEITVSYDTTDSIEYCEVETERIYQSIQENIDSIKNSYYTVGTKGLITQTMTGTIDIELSKKGEKTEKVAERIRELLLESSHKASVTVLDGVVASIVSGMNNTSMTILGPDVETLSQISTEIEENLLKEKGFISCTNNLVNQTTSFRLHVDQEKAMQYGIDYPILIKTLRVGLSSYAIGKVEIEGEKENLYVSFQPDTFTDYYSSISEYIAGYDSEANPILLKDFSTIEQVFTRRQIQKINGQEAVVITVETYGIDTGTATNTMKKVSNKVLKNYSGYEYKSSGVSSYLTDAFKGLIIALLISFILLYVILCCLFESFKKPLIIIFSFPFAFTGGLLALTITRTSLNVVSFIGLIMLMGVIVNDAIVLLERINQMKSIAETPQEQVIEGCKERLRAVLMTTVTTILALLPVALGLGKGGKLMAPLGIVAFGGMFLGTLVTLILIPSVYCVFYHIDFPRKEKKQKASS